MLRIAAVVAWLGVILAAQYRPEIAVHALAPFTVLVASTTQAILRAAGIEALRADSVLYAPGVFAYEVNLGCTGIVPAAVLTIGILGSPGSRAAQWRGVLCGVAIVLGLNLLRLVHLFYLGTHAPGLFAPAHAVVWEAVMVLATFGVWLGWTKVVCERRPSVRGGKGR